MGVGKETGSVARILTSDKGPQVYNLLPPELREFEEIDTPTQKHVDTFKKKLDTFLCKIPDQPSVDDLNAQREADSNSLICQVPIFRRKNPNYRLEAQDAVQRPS